MYYDYRRSRDMAWDILLREQVLELPVKISCLCEHEGALLINYERGAEILRSLSLLDHSQKTDGFTLSLDGRYIIFYRSTCPAPRIRFTLAHELGHIRLGHIPHSKNSVTIGSGKAEMDDSPMERAANLFASRLLAPSCVLWGIGVSTADEIMDLCGISRQAAEFRLSRLLKLYEREEQFQTKHGHGCFLQSPLERQVYEQFRPYIKRNS